MRIMCLSYISIYTHVLFLFCLKTDNASSAPTEKMNITLFTQESTWNEAYYACHYHGMELMTMKSQDKADALSLLFANNLTISLSDTDYWIGLYVQDAATDYFQWTDGDDLGNWTRWFYPEPNQLQSDRCVRLHDDQANSFEWKTMKCNRPYAFICQQYIGDCTMQLTSLLPVQGKQRTVESIASEHDCNNLCLSVILNSTEQCYFSYYNGQTLCEMYLSENSEDFIQVDTKLPKHENYYRKVCFEGFQSQSTVNYTNSDVMPLMNSNVSDSYFKSSEVDIFTQQTTTVITTSSIASHLTLSAITTSGDSMMYEEFTATVITTSFISSDLTLSVITTSGDSMMYEELTATVTTTSSIASDLTLSAKTTSGDSMMYEELTATVITTSFISSDLTLSVITTSSDSISTREPESLEQPNTALHTFIDSPITVVLSTNELASLLTSSLTSQYIPSENLDVSCTSTWTTMDSIMTDHSMPIASSMVIGESEISDQSMFISPVESFVASNLVSSSEISILAISAAETETTYELPPLSLTFSTVSEQTLFLSALSTILSEWSSVEITPSSEIGSTYSEDVLRTTTYIVTQVTDPIVTTIPTIDQFSFRKQCACMCRENRDSEDEYKRSLIEKLLVPKKETMSYKRKLYSVSDQRTSCTILGTFGLLLVILPFVLNTLNDCRTIIKDLYGHYH